MIGGVVRILRPAIEPILKLRLDPPHLPEGTGEPRRLRPSDGYLGYRYLVVLVLNLTKLLGLGALAAVAVWRLAAWGWLIAAPLVLLDLFLIALLLVATRLDWELRHYVLGDRSLRVRQGAILQREITLSYANIQNVEVTQGPIERLFGFQSLKLSTAGGGSAKEQPFGGSHQAWLVGLTNAEEIRELVMESLRRRKDAGLGDADDAVTRGAGLDTRLLVEVRDAARALRSAASSR